MKRRAGKPARTRELYFLPAQRAENRATDTLYILKIRSKESEAGRLWRYGEKDASRMDADARRRFPKK